MPEEEIQALQQLQPLQRNRKLVIKACNKGAGIILLNFEDYIKTCYEHLTSKQSENKPYYTQVNDLEVEKSKTQIKKVLDEGLERQIISKEDYNVMLADDKSPGRF